MSDHARLTQSPPNSTVLADGTTAMIAFAPEDYLHHFEGCEISEAEKDELLRLLWNIMCSFVDLGWGTDAVSLVFSPSSPVEADTSNIDAK
jgi:hypothetical protein